MDQQLSVRSALHNTILLLTPAYGRGEAAAITHILLEWLTGKSRLQILTEPEVLLPKSMEIRLHDAIEKLLAGTPIQYITGTQQFLDLEIAVSPHVLIPRPETEELVLWACRDYASQKQLKILDIGTGSGCIALAMKHHFPDALVTALDKSPNALAQAKANASRLELDIHMQEGDILEMHNQPVTKTYDIILSNPPYIPLLEKATLDKHLSAEPDMALFVPDKDPLLFYKAIALFAASHLAPRGAVYVETHRDYAAEVEQLFQKHQFLSTQIRYDMHGAPRMVKASK
jgi:release factor glutamine methyltransferase